MSRVLLVLLGSSVLILASCKGSHKGGSSSATPPAYNPYGAYGNGYGNPNFGNPNVANANFAGGRGFDQGFDEGFGDEAFGVSAVNGDFYPQRRREVFVSPGDVLSLGGARAGWDRGYSWESSLNERCSYERGFECPGQSNFHWDNGPRYVVPAGMPGVVRITVRAHGGPAETIVLRRGPRY